MPALIGVSEFVEETTADYKSPITSSFVSRMQNMKQTIATLEEVTKNQFFSFINHPSSSTLFALNKRKCHQNPIKILAISITLSRK